MRFISGSEKETFDLGYKVSKKAKAGDVFLLKGSLGVGKSVFVRGMARGLGINEPMPSPSFTILNEYKGKFHVYHFDFYRINDPFELFEIGFEEYINSEGISFIEWPEKAGDMIPDEAILIQIKIIDDKREISIKW